MLLSLASSAEYEYVGGAVCETQNVSCPTSEVLEDAYNNGYLFCDELFSSYSEGMPDRCWFPETFSRGSKTA